MSNDEERPVWQQLYGFQSDFYNLASVVGVAIEQLDNLESGEGGLLDTQDVWATLYMCREYATTRAGLVDELIRSLPKELSAAQEKAPNAANVQG